MVNEKLTEIDGKIYREVARRAKVGEKIKITAEPHVTFDEDRKGEIWTVTEVDGYLIDTNGTWNDGSTLNLFDGEYVVLEPDAPSDEIIDRLAAAGRKIAELTRRVDELERRVGGMAGTKPDTDRCEISRDDVIERAKADVEALENTYYVGPRIRFWPRASVKDGFAPIHYVDYVINRKKRTVVALVRYISDGSVKYKGIAKAATGDVFNIHIGKAIALRRALGLEIPDEYVNAPAPERPRAGDVVRVYCDGRNLIRIIREPFVNGFYWFTSNGHAHTSIFEIIDDSRTGTEREDYGL